MRIAFVASQVPNREYSASTYCALLLLEGLRAAGQEVAAILPLERESPTADASTRRRWLRELDASGFDVRPLPGDPPPRPQAFRGAARLVRLRRALRPRVEDYFPHAALREPLEGALGDFDPDVVLLLSYETVAATDGVQLPRMAFLGEPPHFPVAQRRRPPFVAHPPRLPARALESMNLRRWSEATVSLLARCEGVAINAAQHVDWLRRQGVRHARYLRYPAPDWGGRDWRARRSSNGEPFKIVLIGRVTGSSTLPGLYFLADEVLPALDQALGPAFEVHICGGGVVPDDLAARLRHPAVHVRGYVDDIAAEVLGADVFLVPTPLELGARTRISYAWSCGSRVVSHAANATGLPELVDGTNALLASDGEGIAAAAAQIRSDPVLAERLGTSGRTAYETYFARDVATAALVAELELLRRRAASVAA